jgi:hypothetical protein
VLNYAIIPLATRSKCKDNVCVQEAVVLVDDQGISVGFLITDQAGKVDADNPPQLKGDFISGMVYQTGSDGIEKKIFGVTQSGSDYHCEVSNTMQLFKGRLVDLCGFSAPQTAAPQKVQSGDVVRVFLEEFNFEQVVSARGPVKLGDSNTTAANIGEAFLSNEMFHPSNISVTTFPQDQTQIRLTVIVANATADTKVKVAWTAVDVGDAAPANTKLGEVEYPYRGGDPAVYVINANPSSGVRPIGKYKADIYLDGTFDRTLEFSVK